MKIRFPMVKEWDVRMIGASFVQCADVMNWLTLYRARAGRKGVAVFLGFRLMMPAVPITQVESR